MHASEVSDHLQVGAQTLVQLLGYCVRFATELLREILCELRDGRLR
jgi:hypothetical protein